MVEDILKEMKVNTLARWLQKTLRPISDPWHEGEARRLSSPKATARYIVDLLEDVELQDMVRHWVMTGEYQSDGRNQE